MHTQSIFEVIKDIMRFHDMISNDFYYKDSMPNLTNKRICDFINEDTNSLNVDFLVLINNYHELASSALVLSDFDFTYQSLDLRARVKQKESIINKMFYYTFETEQRGRVSVNKCLNDLLGFRIHLEGFEHTINDVDGICKKIQSDTGYKIACKNSCKDEYQGTHVYFYKNNTTFPWELQIWDKKDEQANELSHQEHKSKRAYIAWPQVYAESKMNITEGGEQ